VFGSLTSIGGGGGGATSSSVAFRAQNGGSGGGGGGYDVRMGAAGNGTMSQGNNGGRNTNQGEVEEEVQAQLASNLTNVGGHGGARHDAKYFRKRCVLRWGWRGCGR